MTRPPSLANLPSELQDTVASYLSQHDSSVCVRVCRAWQANFTPFVWRHIESKYWKVDKNDPPWREVFLESAATGALRTYDHHIHSLDLDEDKKFFERFLEHAPPTFPRLTSAERGTGGWKKIVIYQFGDLGVSFGSAPAEALLKHAPTLEIVRMEGAYAFPSKAIHQLLCSAPKLKELHLLGEERVLDNLDRWMDAHDVDESDWACTSLEIFGCEIRNIPRPDITMPICGDPPTKYFVKGTLQESIDLQRRIGLDLLKDLNELRIVRLDDMEVYIGHDKEQQRVKENWSNVKNISYDEYESDWKDLKSHGDDAEAITVAEESSYDEEEEE
ncbi:hypothetical protein BGX29_010330 [Mortierella sp. GBA35]|nr:hypothetical protein BGX29_010330 [Mortierella sp. GBA35]